MPEQKYPPKPVPIGPDLSTVDRELARFFRGNLPSPDFIPDSRTQPSVYGSQELQDLVKEYGRISPGAMSGVTSISIPSTDVWTNLTRPLSRGPEYTIGGFFDEPTRNIFLSPIYQNRPWDLERILAHELGHSVGYPHNRDLYNIEGLGDMRAEAKQRWKWEQEGKEMIDRVMEQMKKKGQK
jgi:hypothetical protein